MINWVLAHDPTAGDPAKEGSLASPSYSRGSVK
jgi:hypothetical protein